MPLTRLPMLQRPAISLWLLGEPKVTKITAFPVTLRDFWRVPNALSGSRIAAPRFGSGDPRPRQSRVTLAFCSLVLAWAAPAFAASERFVVITGGKTVGRLNVETVAANGGARVTVDYDVKNNGRGPTIAETIELGATGLPTAWSITGATTFGSKVAESFHRTGARATWTDSTGTGSAAADGLYIGQSASPWAYGLYARAMQGSGGTIAALPGGTLRLTKGETLTVTGAGASIPVTRYTISGIDLSPTNILLDAQGQLFAQPSPRNITIRAGYEGEERRLRDLAAKWSTDRFVDIERRVAHRYAGPVRIRNVRLFDPKTAALTAPVSVVVAGRTIAGIEPLDQPATPGEVLIDGAGGTLVAGMTEGHAHLNQEDALLNLVAGITSVRDMGSDNAVLADLMAKIDAGVIGGPRVVRSGFIEGRSPFSSNNGIVVDNQATAVDAVRWYAARGFWQIKIYNSVDPKWVPAMIAEARRLGLRVSGHVPAFATADQMLAAGYDEMTHINQFMLGWVIKPEEDTRTLFRLTALKRLPAFDLNSARAQATIGTMASRRIAIDPTIGIHENLTQNRDGERPRGAADYFANMPIGWQRDATKAWLDTSAPGDDAAYRGAFDKIMATMRALHARGVFIVPGTDTGGALTYHRELELYTQFGMTAPEVLKRATYDMAKYLGEDGWRGAIAKGYHADFFLVPGDPTRDIRAVKTIAMVVKDGTVYFPAEVYPEFGIRPFAPAPRIVVPQ